MLKALKFSILIFVLAGLVYPLVITGLGQLFFPIQANGSFVKNASGTVVGSTLLGQKFTRPEYFHPRPSVNNYDAANSGGSNWGSTNKKLIERVVLNAREYQRQNTGLRPIPIDAVTASASGLDPHISLANALAQVPRVASVRKLKPEALKQMILARAVRSILAPVPYVNVLELNLALDRLALRAD